MGRGERVARGYIGAVLMVQALVVASASKAVSPGVLVLQLVVGALLWVPLVFTVQHTVQVRALTSVPAVVSSIVWAVQSAPVGIVGWGAWAVAVAWLTFPAGPYSPDTLAERSAHGRARTGAQR